MSRKHKLWGAILLASILLAGAAVFLANASLDVLEPAGVIGEKERNLIIVTILLGILVVVPVFILTAWIAWKYREGNKQAQYSPSWDHDSRLEFVWWAVPLAIITVLAVITWNSSHALDPFKPIASDKKLLTVQVVAMQWKWLFIYPEQNVASVNYVRIPQNTPVNFQITSDAPMNSFWIPRLGGQIYAMAGMSTHLHLMATQPGTFDGSSANISGRGFAGMTFKAQATDQDEFDSWVKSVSESPNELSLSQYETLAQPSENNPVTFYSTPQPNLYDNVLVKYMEPGHDMAGQIYDTGMHGHE
ncbi:ubiquinol oxidase subunit II [Candidatus Saccharibacteria bacterium]|nr:ubiquinol oxidase subunit II [Candidatus Saccharibacteria bacterium]